MRKISYLLVLSMLLFVLTGCVKFNANMDIKKDKSMDFSIIYAMNTSFLEGDSLLDENEQKELEKQGFTLTEYSEDNMKGFKLERNIKNIDAVSSTEDTEYSLSGLLDEKKDENVKIFKVKKGLLKNTYIATLSFDASDSENEESSDLIEDTEDNDFDWSSLTEDDSSDWLDDTEDDSSDLDFSGLNDMMSNMDLSFNVSLPYPAKSNNATSTNNDNKELKWNLSSEGTDKIEFEFELYNMSTIYMCIGVVAVLVIVVVVVISSKNKKGNTNNVEPTDQTM